MGQNSRRFELPHHLVYVLARFLHYAPTGGTGTITGSYQNLCNAGQQHLLQDWRGSFGMVKASVVPASKLFLTAKRPPWASTIVLEIVSPIPIPFAFVV